MWEPSWRIRTGAYRYFAIGCQGTLRGIPLKVDAGWNSLWASFVPGGVLGGNLCWLVWGWDSRDARRVEAPTRHAKQDKYWKCRGNTRIRRWPLNFTVWSSRTHECGERWLVGRTLRKNRLRSSQSSDELLRIAHTRHVSTLQSPPRCSGYGNPKPHTQNQLGSSRTKGPEFPAGTPGGRRSMADSKEPEIPRSAMYLLKLGVFGKSRQGPLTGLCAKRIFVKPNVPTDEAQQAAQRRRSEQNLNSF